ncbi:heavy metal-associated isoprenylated plant protein 19-like [Mercurialis annua]|uniref:heavy metal-associated isoprenylated plant protein 19-like n=1 Tax=Mercurialis annua TaxID=3986 RepID=UPI00215FA0B3|nr:heavy metal-associated isoprenylated plant protein 19-like [Mercurialis annua]
MGNHEKKNEDLKVIKVEYKISMYCNACERMVAKIISKFKGVETFTTDMNKHRVIVIGNMNPQKLLKKLKKKTNKRVEIISKKNEEDEDADNGHSKKYKDHNVSLPQEPFFVDFLCKDELIYAFSDENPNACFIM